MKTTAETAYEIPRTESWFVGGGGDERGHVRWTRETATPPAKRSRKREVIIAIPPSSPTGLKTLVSLETSDVPFTPEFKFFGRFLLLSSGRQELNVAQIRLAHRKPITSGYVEA